MKRIPTLAAWILLLALMFSIGVGHADTGASANPDHVTLTWTGNPATTMTITWRTDPSVATGMAEYQAGTSLTTSGTRMNATSVEFVTDLGPSRLFTATLTGLSPSMKYSYRVGDGEHWSDTCSFTTADPKSSNVSFLVFGDSQSSATGESPYSEWRTTVHNAYAANPDARFMVNVGDLVNTGQSGDHWNAWFAAASGVVDRIPAMPILGNHEYSGVKTPTYWMSQFTLPQNGPDGLKTRVYSYDYGPVHVVVLDTEQVKGDNLAVIRKWLGKDLAASKATWKLAFFHKAPYHLKDGRDNPALREAICPALERRHVDIVFNGHDHGIGRTYPIRGGKLMPKPSQGTVYFVTGRSGTKSYKDVSKRAWNAFFYNPTDQPNYLVVSVYGKKLTIKTVKQDGTPLDTFVIDKAKDTSSDGRPPQDPVANGD